MANNIYHFISFDTYSYYISIDVLLKNSNVFVISDKDYDGEQEKD